MFGKCKNMRSTLKKMKFLFCWGLRQSFMNAVVEDWAKTFDLKELRADPTRNPVGDATAEPTDESVGTMSHPVSLILAEYGTQIPLGSKIKVLCLNSRLPKKMFFVRFRLWDRCAEAALLIANSTLALWPEETLVKDLNSWADVQGSTLRVHCTYMVRLWRKSKHKSKSFVSKGCDCFSLRCCHVKFLHLSV